MTGFPVSPWFLRTALFPLVAGLVALGIGLATDGAGSAAGIALTTAITGAGWWALFSRRRTNELLAEVAAADPPSGPVELRSSPLGVGTFVIFAALAACAFLSPSVSGLLFGMAVAQLVDLARVRTWERAHGASIVATREGYTAIPA